MHLRANLRHVGTTGISGGLEVNAVMAESTPGVRFVDSMQRIATSIWDTGSEKRVYRPAAVSLDRAGKILCSFIK